MGMYLSLDTEATGLEEDSLLLQLAFVPVDTDKNQVYEDLGWEVLVSCPSFEELKPKLNKWVVENNEGLIRKAHTQGASLSAVKQKLTEYLNSPPLARFKMEGRFVFLGKSLSALDLPLLGRSFGDDFMKQNFHHHTVDITCVARYLVDVGYLPKGCESTSKIIRHFGIREDARHTALSDALDMAHIYLKLVEKLKVLLKPENKG